ncbi:Six-hairpin glycosidase-like protein [Russula vinacea]|nr:Six-hairpin glycosidase-like protein [Russula vinacea]
MRALATHNDASQLASLPRFLAYASGLTDNLPPNAPPRCTHVRPKPSLKMRLLCLASVVGLVGTSFAPPSNASSYFTTESPIAKTGLLANIGPNGTKSSGAKAGIVIASPNRDNPDYLFSWVRDSSLVFKVITDQFTRGEDNSLRGLIDDFLPLKLRSAGDQSQWDSRYCGLGEPKFISMVVHSRLWGVLSEHFRQNYMWPVINGILICCNVLGPVNALSNLKVYVDSFALIYPINSGINARLLSLSDDTEDKYYNGNPWYLSTFAVAEQLYDALLRGTLLVLSTLSLAPTPRIAVVLAAHKCNQAFRGRFRRDRCQLYSFRWGLAEQFDKKTGKPLSAADLTWSYASVLTAYSAYAGSSRRVGGKRSNRTLEMPPPPQINVTFNVNATHFLDNYPIWSANVTLPQNAGMQYKYIRKYLNDVNWERVRIVVWYRECKMTVNDSWRW